MATTFLEPSGDADFAATATNGFWAGKAGAPVVATDFVHGSHVKSIKFPANAFSSLQTLAGTCADAGSRISVYLYIVTLPIAATGFCRVLTSGLTPRVILKVTTGGVLQLFNASTQIGTDGATLSTGKWYRICMAYTITDSTHNRFEIFVDSVSSISVTNGSTVGTATSRADFGNVNNDANFDIRTSDHYIDNSNALTDTGDIWVTAKRSFANGTTNGFTTQIGAGGSGYGTGHAPQVNERPLSVTNGWSMIGAGSAITEEYNIESTSTGDINISTATIVDYEGWVSASTLNAETASIIVNNVTSNISLTTTNTVFTKIAGSTSYPAGTGTDIGIITTTALTTVSLYECGIVVAYIPSTNTARNLSSLGAGA